MKGTSSAEPIYVIKCEQKIITPCFHIWRWKNLKQNVQTDKKRMAFTCHCLQTCKHLEGFWPFPNRVCHCNHGWQVSPSPRLGTPLLKWSCSWCLCIWSPQLSPCILKLRKYKCDSDIFVCIVNFTVTLYTLWSGTVWEFLLYFYHKLPSVVTLGSEDLFIVFTWWLWRKELFFHVVKLTVLPQK